MFQPRPEDLSMATTTTYTPVVLEAASQAFVEATANPPFLYELTPDEARKVLDDVQAAPIDKLAVDERWMTVPAEVGDVRVRIVRTTGWSASWRSARARPWPSWSTTARPRRGTRSRSSRATRRPVGSSARAPR